MLKVSRTPGPTACLELLHKGCLKRWRKEKGEKNPGLDLGSLQSAAIRLMLECLDLASFITSLVPLSVQPCVKLFLHTQILLLIIIVMATELEIKCPLV